MEIPHAALQIIDTLERAGFEAYAVGGCVRDMLLKRHAQDWDITTSASPQQVKALFARTVDTGIAHGTVTVMVGKEGYEVTTYRVDGAYKDGRHPESVTFTASLEEDLKRRDFTINAMAWHPQRGLIDLFGGRRDLELGIIRCVGEAPERFREDGLRMMRAVRFSAQLGFVIEEHTAAAARELSGRLSLVSRERVQAELVKLLLSEHPDRLMAAARLRLTEDFLKDFGSQSESEQQRRVLAAAALPPQKHLRLAAVLCPRRELRQALPDDELRRETARILKGLKFDNDTTDRVKTLAGWSSVWLYREGMCGYEAKAHIRRLLSAIGRELFSDLVLLQQALYPEALACIQTAQGLAGEVLAAGDCLSLKELAVTGADLIRAGVRPGRQLGEYLERMLAEVLEEPKKNSREYLMGLVSKNRATS